MNLKQLYSFSYMKWNELLKKEYKLGPFVRRACSFCKENKRKNIVFSKILENLPEVVDEITQEDGSKVKQLKFGLEYKWSFNKDRNLVVDLVGFGVAEKNIVRGLAQKEFGNKVKIK